MTVTLQAPPETKSTIAPTNETPPVDTTADEQISPKFAALARQQKMLRKQQMELKAREDALKAKESDYQTNYIPKSRLKTNAFDVLNEEGVEFDKLLQEASTQDPQSIALRKLQAKIDALEGNQNKAAEQIQENAKKQYDAAINNIRNEVKLLVDSDETFEAIKANDAHEAVVALIEETFKESGKILSNKDAATQVEEYLLEQALKMANLNKVKERLAPKDATAPANAVPTKTPSKTLTNANTTAQTKVLTVKERRERAIAAFKGQLT